MGYMGMVEKKMETVTMGGIGFRVFRHGLKITVGDIWGVI